MKFENEDTITAIATPIGSGGISVIRVSGKESITITEKIFSGKSRLAEALSHTIHYGKIISNDGSIIDDVLVSIFRAPNSYTGENSIEISCHGSPLITEKIIAVLLENNVRIANPGEFTKRAFLNGRIDLTQAEAVADLINSRTEASLKGARKQLDGLLSSKIEFLKNSLLDISSLLELELDFAEEDIEFLEADKIKTKINNLISEIDLLLKTYSFGKIIKDGINIAIVGEPNVGKSSLLNCLLKESRAIVSEIPGTTRDVIHEDISIDGLLYKLYDTAGIRSTSNQIEKEGVERSRRIIKESDLVLYVYDVIQGYSHILFNELLDLTDKGRIIQVLNKIDLGNTNEEPSDAQISCITRQGIETLLSEIKKKSLGSNIYSEDSLVLTNTRHYKALENTKAHLVESLDSLQNGMSEEFTSIHLRNAVASLNEIVGVITSGDVLNHIFSKFCIGK